MPLIRSGMSCFRIWRRKSSTFLTLKKIAETGRDSTTCEHCKMYVKYSLEDRVSRTFLFDLRKITKLSRVT